jgi:hypothetical protein
MLVIVGKRTFETWIPYAKTASEYAYESDEWSILDTSTCILLGFEFKAISLIGWIAVKVGALFTITGLET